MKKYAWLLGLLAALFAGCGSTLVREDPLGAMPQAEDELKALALSLADAAEAQLGPQPASAPTPQAEDPRSITLVHDSEDIVLIASWKNWSPPGRMEDILGRPLNLVIRCKSDRRACVVFVPVPSHDVQGGYRMTWYGSSQGGGRAQEVAPLTVETAPTPPTGDTEARQMWSYNKLGIGGFWADAKIRLPDKVVEMRYSLPTTIPGEELSSLLDLTSFFQALRRACCEDPEHPIPVYSVEWPPALLLRPEVAVAFAPYQNPKLRTARSIEDLVGEPLGIAYWRSAGYGAKLTKADAARIMQVKLVLEEPDYLLLATNLKNPSETLRFRVGQVSWCDGCFGQDPPPDKPIPRFLGIEDRLSGPPVLHLQVGPLLLRGIEKK